MLREQLNILSRPRVKTPQFVFDSVKVYARTNTERSTKFENCLVDTENQQTGDDEGNAEDTEFVFGERNVF